MGKITLLLLLVILAFAAQPSFAAFPIKRTTASAPVVTHTNTSPARLNTALSRFRYRMEALTHPGQPVKKTNGAIGTLALVFGIVSFIPVLGIVFGSTLGVLTFLTVSGIFLGSAAVVLGVLGLQKHEKYAGAGLILGVIGVLLDLIILTAIAIATAIGSITFNVM